MTASIIRYLNIILAALLAGTSFGIWIGFNPMNLSPSTYIEQQQNMLQSIRTLMVSLVILSTIITILSAYLQRHDKSTFIFLILAAVLFITCILITRFGNKPIDDMVIAWTKDAIPDNWTELRDNWWSFHKLRTVAEIIALLLVAWTSIIKDNRRTFKTV